LALLTSSEFAGLQRSELRRELPSLIPSIGGPLGVVAIEKIDLATMGRFRIIRPGCPFQSNFGAVNGARWLPTYMPLGNNGNFLVDASHFN